MKKTLNNIFDEANANELEKLVSQNAASEVSADTLSSIKNKVYAKTGITKAKTKKSIAFRWQSYVAVAACFLLIVSAVITLPMLLKDDQGGVFVPGTTNNSGDVTPPVISAPDVIITFDSATDIVEFISAANSQEAQYSEYAEKHSINKNVSYDVAKIFADNCSKTKVLCNKNKVVCDSFSGTYYAERNELSLIYKISGVSYRFIYTFGVNTPHHYEGEPVLQNVKVGSYNLDLYQGEGRLVGSVIDGETAIRIIVKAEQISDIDFELFTIIGN